MQTQHLFSELLAQYRARKPGLSQTRLAQLAGYDQAILVRMGQGKKDLTGPSGRERVVRLIETLADQTALTTLDEANALLLAADLPPLFERQPNEARLIERLTRLQPGHRVRRTNLPAPLTSFVGRTQEIAEVRRLLNTTRLLTLTGAGGCGKTRLALRAAADVLITYSEGVWCVELAALTDPALIPDIVTRAIGLVASDRSAQEQVLDYLRERHVLLVLDNCEHLIEAIALFSIEILRACPRVTILTTSREVLNVDGETVWRVPPLQPDEAGQLFVDRALTARSSANLSAQDETISKICTRLDGMPLAIELAAARLTMLSLSDIAARLKDRFALLVTDRRGTLPRHQTLYALIDWSYDSLTETERRVFRQLGVFVGGWTLEQAEQVIDDSSGTPATHVLSVLTQLVAKSLVTVDDRHGTIRYFYLETLREYAQKKLAEHAEISMAHSRHAETFARFAGDSVRPIYGAQKARLDQVQRDYGNLQAALEWSFNGGSTLTGCRLVGGLTALWTVRTRLSNQASHWAKLAKQAVSDHMPVPLQARVWLAASVFLPLTDASVEYRRKVLQLYESTNDAEGIALGKCVWGQFLVWQFHQVDAGVQLLQESMALARGVGENGDWLVRLNLSCLGFIAYDKGDLSLSESLHYESYQHYRAAGDFNGVGDELLELSNLAIDQAQLDTALKLVEEVLPISRTLDDVYMEIRALMQIAEIERFMSHIREAVISAMKAFEFARENTDELHSAYAMIVLAWAVQDTGDLSQATSLLKDALHILVRKSDVSNEWGVAGLAGVACIASQLGQSARAAQLFGVVDVLRSTARSRRLKPRDLSLASHIAKTRAALGEEAYAAAHAKGGAMTLEQIIAYALS